MTWPRESATKPNDGMGGGMSSRQKTLWLYLTILVCLGASSCKRADPPGTGLSTPTTPAPPPAPAPLAVPTGLHVRESGEDFIEWAWNPVAGTTGYEVQIDLFLNFDLPIDESRVTSTSYRRNYPTPGLEYFLRVRAVAGTRVSEWTFPVVAMVEEQTGAVLFWMHASTGWGTRIDITLDGSQVGSLYAYWGEVLPPDDCTITSRGRVVAERPPGTYAVEAISNNGVSWSFDTTIRAGECKVEVLWCGEDRDCGN